MLARMTARRRFCHGPGCERQLCRAAGRVGAGRWCSPACG